MILHAVVSQFSSVQFILFGFISFTIRTYNITIIIYKIIRDVDATKDAMREAGGTQ